MFLDFPFLILSALGDVVSILHYINVSFLFCSKVVECRLRLAPVEHPKKDSMMWLIKVVAVYYTQPPKKKRKIYCNLFFIKLVFLI